MNGKISAEITIICPEDWKREQNKYSWAENVFQYIRRSFPESCIYVYDCYSSHHRSLREDILDRAEKLRPKIQEQVREEIGKAIVTAANEHRPILEVISESISHDVVLVYIGRKNITRATFASTHPSMSTEQITDGSIVILRPDGSYLIYTPHNSSTKHPLSINE